MPRRATAGTKQVRSIAGAFVSLCSFLRYASEGLLQVLRRHPLAHSQSLVPRLEQIRQPERQGERWLALGRSIRLKLGKRSYWMGSSVVIEAFSSVIVSQVGSFVHVDSAMHVL
jgi:hypothetical protein